MNRTLASVVAALALGLGGCASDPGMGGMVYRDGGYYAPAREGYGDYYVAPDLSDDWYGYDPFYGPFNDPFIFGPSWYGGGGGYCPVRYRYCPSGWYGAASPYSFGFGTGLWIGFGTRSYYDPWGYTSPWAYGSEPFHAWRPPHPRRHPSPTQDARLSPWRPPGDVVGRIDGGGDGDGDSSDGLPTDGRTDGRVLDPWRGAVPDGRFLRRRPMRPQPWIASGPNGESRMPPPQPVRTDQGRGRFGGGDRAERGDGGDDGSTVERGDQGGRVRARATGDDSAPRVRRRDREG